jgi:hypothetical protein
LIGTLKKTTAKALRRIGREPAQSGAPRATLGQVGSSFPPVGEYGFRGTDDELIAAAHTADNGAAFADAFGSAELGKHKSDSEADAGLAARLAFWCGPDPDRIERLMWKSQRVRDKWTEHAEYLALTILNVLAMPDREYYTPKSVAGEVKKLLLGPAASIATREAIAGIPPPPDVIVDRYLLLSGGGLVSPGGVGKTTLAIYESVHIILGRDLYGRRILRPGAVLFITAEDERQQIESSLNQICKALNLSDEDRERVRLGFHIEDVSTVNARLVRVVNGELQPTAFTLEIVAAYRGAGLAYCHLDPVSLLGPGEESGNDGMSELMRTARFLAKELRCSTRAVHHSGKENSRNNVQDQYVGRGGSAFADNARFIHQLLPVKDRTFEFEGVKFTLPAEVTDDDLKSGRILALLVHKLSYQARDRQPIVIRRTGFLFEHIEVRKTLDDLPGSQDGKLIRKVIHFLNTKLEEGIKYNVSLLEGRFKELGIGRNDLRALVEEAVQTELIEECPLPLDEQKGKRKTYLKPADEKL